MVQSRAFQNMVAFCNEIIEEIKNSQSEEELIKVIGSSLTRHRKGRYSFNESRFVLNMIVTLQSINPDKVSPHAGTLIKLAIAIFGKFQRENAEQIF